MIKMKNSKLLFLLILIALGLFLIYKINVPVASHAINTVANTIETATKDSIVQNKVELLGRASVSFAGSNIHRINNIKLGVARLDGTTIPAGEEFSFLESFGTVTAEDGFEEANSFLNGEIISGIGGGICQISTTLFQSAIEAGLPITDRTNHTFSVSYYRTGLDATVSSAGPDLKFLNDTGDDIKIKGYVENESAVFELYGVYDGRMASLGPAKITDIIPAPPTRYINIEGLPKADEHCEHSSQRGYTAEVVYNVLYKDNVNRQNIFNSVYQPFAKICYISLDPITGCTSQTIYSPKTGVKCGTI